jgi:sortase A
MFPTVRKKVQSKLTAKLPLLLLAGGFLFISIGSYDIWTSKQSQEIALTHAEKFVKEKKQQLSLEIEDYKRIDNPESKDIISSENVIGVLSIPSLSTNLAIVEGIDEDALDRGIGHYPGTALPTENDQIVLSGHRDTVFRRLGELKIGEELLFQLIEGSYSYVVTKTKIVDKEDRTIIIPTYPSEELVLITCYPFQYIGNAPSRYIVYATPTYTQ